MDGNNRKNISKGNLVDVVQKPDQRTGNLSRGRVKEILTKSPFDPHGIKVRLESGIVGRVKTILPTGVHCDCFFSENFLNADTGSPPLQ